MQQQLPKAWSQVMRPRGISPSKAREDPGLPEVPDSKRAQKMHHKGGCDRSSAALLAHGRSALDQMLEEMLSKQEKACSHNTCTGVGFRDTQ